MAGKPIPVRCVCGTLFGYADAVGERIIIKHRDLYRIVTGKVEGPCRKCGNPMQWKPTIRINGNDAA